MYAHKVVRRRGTHIFKTVGSQMAACRPLSLGRFLVLIAVRGLVDPRAIVRLEGIGQLRNRVITSGMEPATFRLVA
jgi:hypothetical protein